MSQIQSLRDHVCSYIGEKIKSGDLRPHEKLNEPQICSDLQISRTPAREALIMLAADHIIDFIPRKGFYVREITVDDMLQYYELMGMLDSFAASRSIDYLNELDIYKMKEAITKMTISIDFSNYDNYIDIQQEFHDIYIMKCQNKPLIETIESLRYRYIPITYNLQKTDEKSYKEITHRTNKEHEQIVEYFETKNRTELERYIREVHWDTKHIDLL